MTARVVRTVSVDEVAQVLGVSRNHAIRCVERGQIPSVWIGRRSWFRSRSSTVSWTWTTAGRWRTPDRWRARLGGGPGRPDRGDDGSAVAARRNALSVPSALGSRTESVEGFGDVGDFPQESSRCDARAPEEVVMLIEVGGVLVDGINDDVTPPDLVAGADRTGQGVDEQL